MRYYYRCKKKVGGRCCDTRRVLPRPVEDYIIKPRCHSCKALLVYRDKWQQAKNRENTCNCGDPHYPHRKGSDPWCVHHPVGPTEEDQQNRYGQIPDSLMRG